MRSSREMRQEAWGILTGSKWGWKILLDYIALGGIFVAVTLALAYAYQAAGIQTWETFKEAQQAARRAGIEMAVPSAREAMRMTMASGFSNFVQYLFQGILAFGMVTALLKCVRNESKGWFSGAFGGFGRPLGLLWLTALMALKVFLWSLLLVVPGIVALFRYALAWYVKAENPDMGANACLARSGEIMRGRKWTLFWFSLSYFWWILAVAASILCAAAAAGAFGGAEGGGDSAGGAGAAAFWIAAAAAVALMAFVSVYMAIGQAVFYRDAKDEADSSSPNVFT